MFSIIRIGGPHNDARVFICSLLASTGGVPATQSTIVSVKELNIAHSLEFIKTKLISNNCVILAGVVLCKRGGLSRR